MQIVPSGQSWTTGEDVGAGAFGQVKVVRAEDGTEAVAKFVQNVPEAERESLVAEALKAAGLPHVIPIIDNGVVGGELVIVMPRAELSLRDHLQQYIGPVPLEDALGILSDIAAGLSEIKRAGIVHRDLKPENVLRLDGAWVLCDFGIARFDGAATASLTHKFTKTPSYAAPEQWKQERATSASDVYAFGVIAYELLSGTRPFADADPAALREQHIHVQPEPLAAGPTRLRLLVEECLEKAPEARPSPEQIVSSLHKAATPPVGSGAHRLTEATYGIARDRAAASAERARQETEQKRRAGLFAAAQRSFEIIPASLREAIEANAPIASISDDKAMPFLGSGAYLAAASFEATLGKGKIGVANPKPVTTSSAPFDVIAFASISVIQDRRLRNGYVGRSHSLWYCDPHTAGQFGWHELAFMDSPLGRGAVTPFGEMVPYSASPNKAESAFTGVIGFQQLAWPVEELDRADLSEFIDRWLGWFAESTTGSLRHPTTMPEKSNANRSFRRC